MGSVTWSALLPCPVSSSLVATVTRGNVLKRGVKGYENQTDDDPDPKTDGSEVRWNQVQEGTVDANWLWVFRTQDWWSELSGRTHRHLQELQPLQTALLQRRQLLRRVLRRLRLSIFPILAVLLLSKTIRGFGELLIDWLWYLDIFSASK